VFCFGVGDFARTLLILRATQLLTPRIGFTGATAAAMALYVGHNGLYAAASYPVGWLADRVNPRRLLVVGYALGTATAVLAAVATPSLWLLGLLFATAGATVAFEDTLEGTITALEVPSSLRGTGYGVLATTNGVGDLVSSSLVGVLWSASGPAAAFGAAAALCAAGAAILFTTSGRSASGSTGP
jgi:MFS family permease